MNTNANVDKFQTRKKYVNDCGSLRNKAYSEYLESCSSYDNLKKAFYIAVQLSKHDGDFTAENLENYEHMIQHFDKQVLNHLKHREFEVQEIKFNDGDKNQFRERIIKIETAGLSRNRKYYAFVDDQKEFNEAISLFYNEISLAFRDGLITNIDYEIRCKSMKNVEKYFEGRLIEIRSEFNKKRVSNHNFAKDGNSRDSNERGRVRGRERNRRGWRNNRFNYRSNEWSSNGRGRARGSSGRGRRSNIRNQSPMDTSY